MLQDAHCPLINEPQYAPEPSTRVMGRTRPMATLKLDLSLPKYQPIIIKILNNEQYKLCKKINSGLSKSVFCHKFMAFWFKFHEDVKLWVMRFAHFLKPNVKWKDCPMRKWQIISDRQVKNVP